MALRWMASFVRNILNYIRMIDWGKAWTKYTYRKILTGFPYWEPVFTVNTKGRPKSVVVKLILLQLPKTLHIYGVK
jgi:hypothetical protein